MSGLTLQLLGPPSASVSRAPPGPGMGAAKNLALLAYLALEPGSHSRESLAALLWGESPEQAARASLRQALRRLRAAVGDDLRIGHGTVELRGPVECDVTAFLATAHYLDGDCGEALGRFATYRARLAQDIGAQPAVAVVELAQRIESEARAERRTPPAELETPVPSFQASLVGRDGQWRALAATWRAVVGGSGRVTLLEGEAGVGQTPPAEEFLPWVGAEGGALLRGRGYDAATGIPYGPVVEALRGALAAPRLGGGAPPGVTEALRLVAELRRRFPTLPQAPP